MHPALAHQRVEAFGKVLDEVPGKGALGGVNHFFFRGVRLAVTDVAPQVSTEQNDFLWHKGHALPVPTEVQFSRGRFTHLKGSRIGLMEAKEEREKLEEANRERKKTVLQIANTVQGMYIKLKCRDLEENVSTEDNINAQMKRVPSDRKITMFAGEQISERNILNHMELIERRAIEIIAQYAVTLDSRRFHRRPSVLLVFSLRGCLI